MNFLRTLFVIILVVLVMIFAFRNWTEVSVSLWGGLLLFTKLPVLLLIAFLLGFVPMAIIHRTAKWRWKRRLETHERSLADLQGIEGSPVAARPPEGAPPPASVPTAVPPGVA